MKLHKTRLLNWLILSFGKLNHYKYHFHKKKVDIIQQAKLFQYISRNCTTAYGKDHHFQDIKNYDSFAANVPVIEEWEQLTGYIKRIEAGEMNILCSNEIVAFEETSGSTGFSKSIPYNKDLRNEFQKALQVWMLDLQKSSPQCFYGQSYWSLSPVLKETRYTAGGIRIGLESDSEYFNPFIRFFLKEIMAVSPETTRKKKERYDFYFTSVTQLLLKTDLSFISVWSPTFFLQLDQFIRENQDALLHTISTINSKRYYRLTEKMTGSFTWKDIWPALACLSCWTDAQASIWIPEVKRALGPVSVQPKGLLSTEAVVSIPIQDAAYPALAYHSHFFEFRNIDDNGILLAHQLAQDKRYEVIVTTAGGLYRYATKDVVQVKGFYCQVPLLQFLGRRNRTSDLVGEKVSDIQVNEILGNIRLDTNVELSLIFMKPHQLGKSAQYIVYIEETGNVHNEQAEEITRYCETMLCQNPYYKQALNTGQLKPMQYKLLAKGFKDKLSNYYVEKKLIKEGDVKLPGLFLEHELRDLKPFL